MRRARQIPLNALRVFDAVAKHMSFTRGGEELGITQTAVSYQIRLLEGMLEKPLFLRRPRRIELTETGARLAPRVAEAFGLLDEALTTVLATTEETLVINTTPTFAAHWLASHIGKFQLSMPHIAVRMMVGLDKVDFARDCVDVAIRYGAGGEPGVVTHELMSIDYTPMLSPSLVASRGPFREPRDLLALHLIDAGDPWWRVWFDAAGVPDADLEGRPDSHLGAQTYEAHAAIAGHGVAILTPAFHQAELAAGVLIQPFPLICRDGGNGYLLTYPETRRHQSKIKVFRDWLLREIAETPI